MQRLEDKCLSLYATNQQLQAGSQASQDRFEKTRELNRRLCRDINDSRTERTAALEELDRHKAQMEQVQQKLNQGLSENAALREALEATQLKMLELLRSQSDSCSKPSAGSLLFEFPPGLSAVADDADAACHEISIAPSSDEDEVHFGDAVCRCNTGGCSLHRVYSDSLLLAHRGIASKILRGPPGLELELPPGLEFAHTQTQEHGLHTVAW